MVFVLNSIEVARFLSSVIANSMNVCTAMANCSIRFESNISGDGYNIDYQNLDKKSIGEMMTRIGMPYGSEYSKDADYIQDVKDHRPVNSSNYGTTGRIYQERQD